MGAITYLLLHKLKNAFKQLLKSPAKLIYAIFMIGILVLFVVARDQNTVESIKADISYLLGGIVAVYALIFYLSINKGFQSGASIFRMPDINLLFVSPYHARTLLIYGLIQQLGTTIFAGIFLVFQYAWLNNAFGVDGIGMLFIMIGYMLVLFTAQLLSMVIYNLTHSNDTLKRILKLILYLPPVAFIAYYVIPAILNGEGIGLSTLSKAGNSIGALCLPVFGWLTALVKAVLVSDSGLLVIGVVASVGTVAASIASLFMVEMDYYEDVLQTTEASYTSVTAAKEGRIQEAAPRNIKKGKIGIGKGKGAETFYYKHRIENRRGKLFVLPTVTLVLIVCGIVASFFLKEIGLIPIFAFMIYMKVFTVGMDKLPRELLKPFIYLVPESSFKKLFCCMKEAIPGYFLEAILLYVPAGLIMEVALPEIAIFVLASVSFSFLFIAGNLFVERVLGRLSIRMLLLMLYMVILVLLSVPGILIGSIFAANVFVILSTTVTVLLFSAICNLLLALLLIFASRNLLEYAELNY